MKIKSQGASEQLAKLIKSKTGTAVNRTSNTPSHSQQIDSRRTGTIGASHGLHPQFTFSSEDNLLKRAQKRQQLSLLRKQQNLENILTLSLEFVPDVNLSEEIDPDWFEHFVLLAEKSSSAAMQNLWAKILASETIEPGTYSFKSLKTLEQMTKKEAEALTRCAALCGRSKLDNSQQILFGYYKKPSLINLFSLHRKCTLNISESGLSYPQILMLIDMDLIYGQEIESAEMSAGEKAEFKFQSYTLQLTAKTSGCILTYYKLTQAGEELTRLTQPPLNKQYMKNMEQQFIHDFELEWLKD